MSENKEEEKNEELTALGDKISQWLGTVPIGGSSKRGYDPKQLVDFAVEKDMKNDDPEAIYKAYVDFKVAEAEALTMLDGMKNRKVENKTPTKSATLSQSIFQSIGSPLLRRLGARNKTEVVPWRTEMDRTNRKRLLSFYKKYAPEELVKDDSSRVILVESPRSKAAENSSNSNGVVEGKCSEQKPTALTTRNPTFDPSKAKLKLRNSEPEEDIILPPPLVIHTETPIVIERLMEKYKNREEDLEIMLKNKYNAPLTLRTIKRALDEEWNQHQTTRETLASLQNRYARKAAQSTEEVTNKLKDMKEKHTKLMQTRDATIEKLSKKLEESQIKLSELKERREAEKGHHAVRLAMHMQFKGEVDSLRRANVQLKDQLQRSKESEKNALKAHEEISDVHRHLHEQFVALKRSNNSLEEKIKMMKAVQNAKEKVEADKAEQSKMDKLERSKGIERSGTAKIGRFSKGGGTLNDDAQRIVSTLTTQCADLQAQLEEQREDKARLAKRVVELESQMKAEQSKAMAKEGGDACEKPKSPSSASTFEMDETAHADLVAEVGGIFE
eukprot:g209.t1